MEPASIAIGMVRTRGVAPWPPCRATSLISINNPVHGACRHEFKKNGSGKGNWGSLHDDVMCVPGLAGGTACPAGSPVGQHAWEIVGRRLSRHAATLCTVPSTRALSCVPHHQRVDGNAAHPWPCSEGAEENEEEGPLAVSPKDFVDDDKVGLG